MKLSALVMAALAMCLFVGGCGAVRGGRTVVKHESGQPARVTEVQASGTYALYSMTDFQPKVKVNLKEGDQIGFRMAQDGRLEAVAGSQTIPLASNETYYWKLD